jgi:FMNH2-dependent dimethyl sulfone monooxygenase
LKLGLFAFNGVGNTISNLPPRDATWPTNLRVARIADAAGFEALVSYARWKGVARPEPLPFQPHDAFESFTWAAALAQATNYSAVLATVHIPMMHPILVAKMATTVDHISNGRFGINVVAGWNGPEFKMFGTQLKEHDDRYAEGAEWMEILRRLWTEREFDFAGAYYTIERGESFPKPVQQPYPPIMNAGGSAAGRAFAAKYADLCFVMTSPDNSDDVAREQIASYREQARRDHGKDIAVWTYADVVLRETQDEAEAYARYVDEHRNEAAANAVKATRSSGEHQLTLDSGKTVARTAHPLRLIGDAGHINEQLNALSGIGIDGVVLVAQDFEAMTTRWAQTVLPLMERDGLRLPHETLPLE